ncbi:MAG: IS5 family transposase [Acetobacteraceae bacterium]
MWTPTTRRQHSRAGLRYGSDVTDAEWLILSPFLLAPRCCGRHRKWEMREIINAIFYVLRGGIAWSLLPKDFPPVSTTYRWFARFRDDGTWERINHCLVMLDRERVGREASPTAVVIDSQSVRTTESGGIRGYDAGKKIKGRKRHAMVDTDGRALKLQAHSAAIQDRDGAGPLLRASRASWPFVALGYADGGYSGPRVANASPIRIEVVRKSDNQVGFAVIARRWVVERFFAWINRNRRLAKDFEATIQSVEAFLYAASATLLLRRLAR